MIKLTSWLRATVFFLIGYAIATLYGFLLYYVSEILMWISMFTLMPAVFAYLFYRYLKIIRITPAASFMESLGLVLYWIGFSFALDATAYILIIPLIFRAPPNWTFFIDQSPWIWLCYLMLFCVGYTGRWFYLRFVESSQSFVVRNPGIR